jgi:hypothetical protein
MRVGSHGGMSINVLWDVTPCNLVRTLHHISENRDIKFVPKHVALTVIYVPVLDGGFIN